MNMEIILSVLGITLLGIVLSIFVLSKVVNKKLNTSVEKLVTQNQNSMVNTAINSIKKDLESYKEESRHWYQEYKKEVQVRQNYRRGADGSGR